MFELSVACKYLLPRRRQLSVSIISLISILVISLVVWLVVVFFSVTNGIEKHWVGRLTALTAPVRVTPTEAYYNSYYYQVDGISNASGYNQKSIGEKLAALTTDPYDTSVDEEIASTWAPADRTANGELRDIVKETFAAIGSIKGVPGLRVSDYETTFGSIRIRLVRETGIIGTQQSFLSQSALFGSLDPANTSLGQALLPLRREDITNILNQVGTAAGNIQEEATDVVQPLEATTVQNRLKAIFQHLTIQSLKTPKQGWQLPRRLLPADGKFEGLAVTDNGKVRQILLPESKQVIAALLEQLRTEGRQVVPVTLKVQKGALTLADNSTVAAGVPLILPGNVSLKAALIDKSIASARSSTDLQFEVNGTLQGSAIKGQIPFRGLEVDSFTAPTRLSAEAPLPWLVQVAASGHEPMLILPDDVTIGRGVLLPKTFRDAGILVGDRGYLGYQTPTVSSVQEQRIPVVVTGFYDQGIIPIGGKFVLVNRSLTSSMRAGSEVDDKGMTNGINVMFNDYTQAEKVAADIKKALKERGLDRYWEVTTFRNFEFTKELLLQLSSDKNLFMIIASVIIIVACSNIISMLIILVNDKKLEIGILRSMGASSQSIAAIFGVSGMVMGLLGSLLGTLAAVFTLKHLDKLLWLLERVQGHQVFNPTFYGNTLPGEVSGEALVFVLVATTLISLLAGVIPAIKASILKPSAILRSE